MNIVKLINHFTRAGIKLSVGDKDQLNVSAPNGVMTGELKQMLVDSKAEILDYLKTYARSSEESVPDIAPYSRDREIPLSFSQRRLWFVDKLNQGSVEFNSLNYFEITEGFSESALREAVQSVLDRHEVLRTCFAEANGEPVQLIQQDFELPIQVVDISELESSQVDAQISSLAQEEVNRPFDLSSDLMLRVTVVKCSEGHVYVFYVTHHIASDGWSSNILRQELITSYQAACENTLNDKEPLAVQYADYAIWQNDLLGSDAFESQLKYWLKQLDGMPELHGLPTANSRYQDFSYTSKTRMQSFDQSFTERLKTLCSELDITLFMLLHGAFSLLVSRYSNQSDVVIGTAVAGRTQQVLEPLIGFFINDLVLRADCSESQTIRQYFDGHRKCILDGYQNQLIPFDMLVEKINPLRSRNYSPLFQIKMDLQNHSQGKGDLEQQSDAEGFEFQSKEDLYLSIVEYENGLSLAWRYNTNLFDANTVDSLQASLFHVLESICTNLDQTISNVPLASADTRNSLIQLGKGIENNPLEHDLIHKWFEEQVLTSANQVAVVCGKHTITYEQLNSQANQIAHYLIEQGVKLDSLVAVCTERSIDMIIGILAVLKAGGAYLPLDPAYPDARLSFMIEDSGVEFVLTQQELMSELNFGDCGVLPLDSEVLTLLTDKLPKTNPEVPGLTGQSIAYGIYTSGSTGTPRAVLVGHDNIVASNAARLSAYEHQPKSFVLLSSFSFDSSVAGIFWTLASGGELVIAEPLDGLDRNKFSSLLNDNQASHFLTLPSVYQNILTHEMTVPKSMKQVIVAGEACSVQVVSKHHQHEQWSNVQLTNEYGPTETSVWASYHQCDDTQPTSVPIGRSAPHVNLYIVDDCLQLVPQGVTGELLVAGRGVSRGYLNQPELTANKFIPDPFCEDQEQQMYRTGDLVRWSSSGLLEYVGRSDGQVKIRGFRVELLEVENALKDIEAIETCVVVVKKSPNEDQRLVAYVVLKESLKEKEHESDSHLSGVELTLEQVRSALISSFKRKLIDDLPEYMVPSVFVILEVLPAGPNGKVDKAALPEPQKSDMHDEVYVAATTDTEKKLCKLWEEVLSLEKVGIEDNFFLLGGHSLLATQLISSIREHIGVELPLHMMFDFPTISGLAKEVDVLRSNSQTVSAINDLFENANLLSESADEIEEGVL